MSFLELLIPKCRNEIWITGYRLIMTGKSPFAERSARPAPRRRALEFGCWRCRPGAGPTSWYTAQRMCRTIISRFFRSLQLRENYGTNLEIRFTEKPIFNDTYKIDDRFITGPYLHCLDKNNGRITAKDFSPLDINDPQKELYGLIYRDYMTVWEKAAPGLTTPGFFRGSRPAGLPI